MERQRTPLDHEHLAPLWILWNSLKICSALDEARASNLRLFTMAEKLRLRSCSNCREPKKVEQRLGSCAVGTAHWLFLLLGMWGKSKGLLDETLLGAVLLEILSGKSVVSQWVRKIYRLLRPPALQVVARQLARSGPVMQWHAVIETACGSFGKIDAKRRISESRR